MTDIFIVFNMSNTTSARPAFISGSYNNTIIFQSIREFFFAVGIIGNFMNLLLLGGRRVNGDRRSSLERSAVAGLRALTLSDMMFCVVGLSVLFARMLNSNLFPIVVISKYYATSLNVFLFTSTWLIVLVSVER